MDISIGIVPATILFSLLGLLAAGRKYLKTLIAELASLTEDIEQHGTRIAVFGMTTNNVNQKFSLCLITRTASLLKMKRRSKPGVDKFTDLPGFETDLEAGFGRTHTFTQTDTISTSQSLPPLVVRPSGHVLI